MKYDAIIILGEPLTYDGDLGVELTARAEKAIEIFKKKQAKKIIASGGKTSPNKKGITEAEGMKQYLIGRKIPARSIVKEENSKDTIGNALFTKTKILDSSNWKKILIVTSDYHIPRAKYIFQKILGNKFKLDFQSSKSNLDAVEFAERKLREDIMIGLDKIFMEEFHALLLKE